MAGSRCAAQRSAARARGSAAALPLRGPCLPGELRDQSSLAQRTVSALPRWGTRFAAWPAAWPAGKARAAGEPLGRAARSGPGTELLAYRRARCVARCAARRKADDETKERAQQAKAEMFGRQQASAANAAVAATLGKQAKWNKWDTWGGGAGDAGGSDAAAGKAKGKGGKAKASSSASAAKRAAEGKPGARSCRAPGRRRQALPCPAPPCPALPCPTLRCATHRRALAARRASLCAGHAALCFACADAHLGAWVLQRRLWRQPWRQKRGTRPPRCRWGREARRWQGQTAQPASTCAASPAQPSLPACQCRARPGAPRLPLSLAPVPRAPAPAGSPLLHPLCRLDRWHAFPRRRRRGRGRCCLRWARSTRAAAL